MSSIPGKLRASAQLRDGRRDQLPRLNDATACLLSAFVDYAAALIANLARGG
jgi:hypothetical protein